MLKIRDGVDLKELEKFGFGFDKDLSNFCETIYSFNEKWNKIIVQTCDGKTVNGDLHIYSEFDCNCENIPNILYDLIKAGLVEKVDE